MALPGQPGRPVKNDPQAQLALAEAHGKVVRLRLAGVTWERIAKVTKYSPRHCRAIYYEAIARASGEMDVQAHRTRLFVEYEKIADVLRPWVTGDGPMDSPPPDKDHLDGLLKVLRDEARLLGTDAPKQTTAATQVTVTTTNEDADDDTMDFVRRVALFARATKVVTIDPVERAKLEAEAEAEINAENDMRRAERIGELVDMLRETPLSHQPQRPVLEVGSNGHSC